MSKFFRNGVQGYVRGGLKQRTQIDPRRIMLSAFMKQDRIAAYSSMPANFPRGYDVGALGNDRYGCCVYAAIAHYINVFRLNNQCGGMITEWMVLAEYAHTGFIPEDPSTDNGEHLLAAIKRWKNEGLFGTRIDAFAELDPLDNDQVAFATSNMGGVIYAFGLPVACQDQEVWDAKAERSLETADDLPWSLGGHAITGLDASPGRDHGETWGERKGYTVPWRRRYASEAYAVVFRDGIPESERSPISGLDMAGLLGAADAVGRL
jgi:hypothetical protein